MDREEIIQYLKSNLKEQRYAHSVRTEETALMLGRIYHADLEKISVSALLHDCAKRMSYQELIEAAKKYQIPLDDNMMCNLKVLHGPVGAKLAEHELGIKDEEILGAIAFHTIGDTQMTLVQKIIFLADGIEPQRSYPDIYKIRHLAKKNLDLAILLYIDRTIGYVLAKQDYLHPKTIEVRNVFVKTVKEQRGKKSK